MVMLILRRKKPVSDRKKKIAKKGEGLGRNWVHPFYGNRTTRFYLRHGDGVYQQSVPGGVVNTNLKINNVINKSNHPQVYSKSIPVDKPVQGTKGLSAPPFAKLKYREYHGDAPPKNGTGTAFNKGTKESGLLTKWMSD